ncbi:MAG: NUDIX domain-containing protein [Patescibacteria group bacterium]
MNDESKSEAGIGVMVAQNEPEQGLGIKVGIGVMVMKDGKVLMHKRKGAHGENTYAWPGGHMEYMESFEDCAKRETREEADIEITNIRFLRLMNLKAYAPKHYVDIGLVADWKSGEPKVMEPEKNDGWDWYDLDNLPRPVFETIPSYIEAYRNGRYFYDN